MSMIIERARNGVLVAGAALSVWLLVLVGGTLLVNPGRVLVLAPRGVALEAAMRVGASLVEVHGATSVLSARSDGTQRAGFVRSLYAGGAWLVLPVLGGGC